MVEEGFDSLRGHHNYLKESIMWKPLNETYFVRPEEIKVSPLVLEQYKKDHVELMTGVVTHVGTGVS